jgi:hypothetical protein
MTLKLALQSRAFCRSALYTSVLLAMLGCNAMAGSNSEQAEPDLKELGKVSSHLDVSGGVRILSDTDPSYGLNAFGVARDGGPVELWQDCPKSDTDCVWTYRQGMLVSATDPTLAIIDSGTDLAPLTLSAACTPSNPACTWTWSKGMFINTASGHPINAYGGPHQPNPSSVVVNGACTAADTNCTWTIESAPLASEADPRLGVSFSGTPSTGTPLQLLSCSPTNPSCTWTFRQGYILSDANQTLGINAYGGAAAGAPLKLHPACAPGNAANPDCTWTVTPSGFILSDRQVGGMMKGTDGNPVPTDLAINSASGPTQGNTLQLSPTIGNPNYYNQVPAWLSSCKLATANSPACAPGYGCVDAQPPYCLPECFTNTGPVNPNCVFDVAPPNPNAWSAPTPPNKPPTAEWTLMAVMFGDQLSYDALYALHEMAQAGSSDKVNILVFLDSPSVYNYNSINNALQCPLYQGHGVYLRINRNAPPTVLSDLEVNPDMSQPSTVEAFGSFAISNFPANRYGLIFSDHGGGWIGFGEDEVNNTATPLYSFTNGNYTATLQAISNATANKKLDIVAFDACLMGMWEVATATASYANYMVASEQEAGHQSWQYTSFLPLLLAQPTMTAQQLGQWMVDTYPNATPPINSTLSEIDLNQISSLNTIMSSLGSDLQNPSLYSCVAQASQNMSLCGWPYVDLYDFAANLVPDCGNLLSSSAGGDSILVQQELVNHVVTRTNNSNLRVPGYPGGLSIYLPGRCTQVDPNYYADPGDSWSTQSPQWKDFLRGFAPPAAEYTLPAPILAATTGTSGTSVNLSWTMPLASDGLPYIGTTYSVSRGTSPGAENMIVAPGLNATTYTDTGLNPNQAYYYAVVAMNCTESPLSNEVSSAPPVVSITAPASNASYTAPASITITASDSDAGGTVSKVVFYQGSTVIGTVNNPSSSCSFTWSNVAAGSYSLSAWAYDNSGVITKSAPVNITVSAPKAPTVSITSPANSVSYTPPAGITINASASETGGTISKVVFYQGSTMLYTDTTAPYSYNWTIVAAGNYTLTAKAYDSAGVSTTSAAVNVTVGDACSTSGSSKALCSPWTVKSEPISSTNLSSSAVCVETTSMSSGYCGNMSKRTLTVNGTTMTCNGQNWASLPAKRNGGYCIQVSAGTSTSAYYDTK